MNIVVNELDFFSCQKPENMSYRLAGGTFGGNTQLSCSRTGKRQPHTVKVEYFFIFLLLDLW